LILKLTTFYSQSFNTTQRIFTLFSADIPNF